MKRSKLFLGSALMTLLGCSDAMKPGDLAVSITTTASQIKSGESVGVNVTVTNVGDRAYTIEGSGCPRLFRVSELEGNTMPPQEICSLVSKPVRLVPGDSYSLQYQWVAEQVSFEGGAVVRNPLPPGSYTFRGQVYSGEFGPISAGTTSVYVF